MKNYSLTYTGIIVMVVGELLLSWGFSEGCTNELITNIALLVGGAIAFFGRYRAGGVTPFGVRK